MNIASPYILFDIITVFLLAFFSLFLLTLQKGVILRHRLLAAFLLALALSYMDGVFISFSYYFHYTYPHIVHLCMSFDFLVGPLLLMYILSVTRTGFRLKPLYLLHTLPFVLHAGFLASKLYLHPAGRLFSREEIIVLTTTSNLHLFSYMIAVLAVLRSYQSNLKTLYSNPDRHGLSWLVLVATGLFFAGMLRFANNLMWLKFPDSPFHDVVDLKLFAISGVFLFACTVVFRTLRRPELVVAPNRSKYQTAPLPEDDKREYLARITAFMESDRPWLSPTFDLAALARGVSLKPHQVSQILNTCLNRNFFDFTNGYRVAECKKLLADSLSRRSITDVMYEAGFSSKSVFNTAFKKFAGVTPSRYRRSMLDLPN